MIKIMAKKNHPQTLTENHEVKKVPSPSPKNHIIITSQNIDSYQQIEGGGSKTHKTFSCPKILPWVLVD